MAQAELAQAGLGNGGAAPADEDAGTGAGCSGRADGVERALVVELLDEARAALGRLDGAFERFVDRAALRPTPPSEVPAGPAAAPERRERRSPAPLPPATFDDSIRGGRAPRSGRRASSSSSTATTSPTRRWHGRPPADQRERLLGACDELHARLGTDVEVVFDGVGEEAVPTAPRAGVRHRFTPAGIEADDVILATVDEEPACRPVVVVSSDRRVRDGARPRGANVLGAKQFLHVLRR